MIGLVPVVDSNTVSLEVKKVRGAADGFVNSMSELKRDPKTDRLDSCPFLLDCDLSCIITIIIGYSIL